MPKGTFPHLNCI